MNISFCIITLNEEKNLARCLASCAGLADEIIVLDSGSTDATETIARQFGARFEPQTWLGFVGQKNKVLALATHEWVFSLDADEELSPALRAEILALKTTSPAAAISGFSLPRCVLYEGRWIRHGDWYPDRLIRLFRRERGKFVGQRVHERLEISGQIEILCGDLHHYSFADGSDHWQRCQYYAGLWAQEKFEAGKTVGPLAPGLHAAFRWLRGYVLRGGFLDGPQGWRIARFCARETHLKYHRLRVLNQGRSLGQARMNILLIRLKSIGDVIFTLPAVNVVRDNYPTAKITFLTSLENASLLAGFREVNEVIPLDRAAFRSGNPLKVVPQFWGLLRRLRAGKFDLVVDLQGYGETAWLTRLTGAAQRWGSVYGQGREWAYTLGVTRDNPLHHVERGLAILRAGGLPVANLRNTFTERRSGKTPAGKVTAAERGVYAASPAAKFWPVANQRRREY
jgi:glycosyltransferase involved in cell wall biosynthesis